MQFETLEHAYTEKTNDWYAVVIIIAASFVAVEFMMNNFLLIALTIVATSTFIMMAARKPKLVPVEIRKNGIRFGENLITYQSLDGFAIVDYTPERRLLLESKRTLLPLIVIHLPPEVDSEELHVELSQYLLEKNLHESIPQIIMERIGF